MKKDETIRIFEGDIPEFLSRSVKAGSSIGWDIETSGLDWKADRIATCQLAFPDGLIAVVRIAESAPKNLIKLLGDSSVRKVFHHAMFDLRFMCHYWGVKPANIGDTKIAAKLLDVRNLNSHSLKPVLRRYLAVRISKRQQTSNWFRHELSDSQIRYAARDSKYLVQLLAMLENELKLRGLREIAEACYSYIPTRVQMDLLGYGNVFDYP